MRYAPGHKEDTRRRILEVAGRRFRRDGIEAVGLVPIMKDAGLTHGGFYAHFPSKDALVVEAVREAFAETNGRLGRAIEHAPPGQGFEALLDRYLNEAHRDAPEAGCTAAALAGELARASDSARQTFAEGIRTMVDLAESVLEPSLAAAEKRRRAQAVVSTMIGALMLARTIPDQQASRQILADARQAALDIARA
jgi:TetR/AcrR family transcriptional repressor of nem operon